MRRLLLITLDHMCEEQVIWNSVLIRLIEDTRWPRLKCEFLRFSDALDRNRYEEGIYSNHHSLAPRICALVAFYLIVSKGLMNFGFSLLVHVILGRRDSFMIEEDELQENDS
ncbi:hypothetical protein Tco_1214364 [Tanacetum coccineum]